MTFDSPPDERFAGEEGMEDEREGVRQDGRRKREEVRQDGRRKMEEGGYKERGTIVAHGATGTMWDKQEPRPVS